MLAEPRVPARHSAMALASGPDMTVAHEESTAAGLQPAAEATGQAHIHAPAVDTATAGTASVASTQHPHPEPGSGHKRPRSVRECGAPPAVLRRVRPRSYRHITTPPSRATATLAARVKMATEPGIAIHDQESDIFLLSAAIWC